ncbi:MAG: SDR family NAD(P)-dependent oxidoreductase [Mesorhizobium sp.]|nr:MAG: SDR family NAD(P)-dependent oxidoreductase [Mesorhizobium sp.]
MGSFELRLPDIVVVTGTASGLGLEVARQLLQSNCQVVGVDMAPSALESDTRYQQVTGSIADTGTWNRVVDLLDAQASATLGLVTCAAILTWALYLKRQPSASSAPCR